MDEPRYRPEDIDPTGRPYDDAVPIGGSAKPTVNSTPPFRGYAKPIQTFNFTSTASSNPHHPDWPFIPQTGTTIFVRSPRVPGKSVELEVSKVNIVTGDIHFSQPLRGASSGNAAGVTYSYIHFNSEEWKKGWTFSDKP
jgi:hypothetical protein